MVRAEEQADRAKGFALSRIDVEGFGELFVEEIHALVVPGELASAVVFPVEAVAVGLGHVDVAVFIGLEESVFLRKGNEVGGSDDVFGVGDIDRAEQRHVGHDGNLVVGHFDRRVLVTGELLKIPGFVGIGKEQRVALIGAVGVDDVCEQLRCVACGRRLGQ